MVLLLKLTQGIVPAYRQLVCPAYLQVVSPYSHYGYGVPPLPPPSSNHYPERCWAHSRLNGYT